MKYFASDWIDGDDTLTAYALAIGNEAGYEIPENERQRLIGALTAFVEGRIQVRSALETSDLSIRKLAAIEALSRYGAAESRMLDSISIDPNVWPTSAVLDWLNILNRVETIPNRQTRIAAAEGIIRARLNFQGTTLGFSTDRTDALWWLMISTDSNATRALLTMMDRPAWREDIPRLVRGTIGRQQFGRWNTTVANAWGTLALEKFSAAFESTPVTGETKVTYGPLSKSLVWTKDNGELTQRLPWQDTRQSLALTQIGTGRPWATVRASAAIPLKTALSSGFAVTRTVTAVEQQQPGHFHRGDVVRVHLDVDAQSEMTWVVIDDPIPAGASVLGSGLGGQSHTLTQDEHSPRIGLARVRAANVRRLSRVLPIRTERALQHRIHRSVEQPGYLPTAADARRSHVRAGNVRRAAERSGHRGTESVISKLRAVGAVAIVVLCAAYAWLPPRDVPDFATVRSRWQPSEAYLLDRHGALIDTVRIDYGVRRFDWIPLEAVSPPLIDAVVIGEDRRFWTHHGFDWRAAAGALRDKLTSDRRRGASTITMQLASMIDPGASGRANRRGWRDKIEQIRAARAIESTWTKQEILEAYLNLLGFRGELEGIDAATRLLAGKTPAGLSLPESLVLAALLPAPSANQARITARACARARAVQSAVTCGEIEATAGRMLDRVARIPIEPTLAPELARTLLTHPGKRLQSTLDADTQTMARNVMDDHLRGLALNNVRDGAALVVDNASGDVLAYVGSAGPSSRARHVDGVRAHRQAGSTLKPFLYQLALERRYITNASLLDDSPIGLDTATGVYLPQNYDRNFKGLVSVRTALGSSLNVPAVRTLVLVGVEAYRDRLHALGYSAISEEGEFYGYSLALGSAEVSLWEQVSAYRVLALGGVWSPLRLRANDPAQAPRRLLAADAAFLATDILADRAARVATFGLDNNMNTAFWSAAKTGTSKDLRDNWCIGFTDRYTVGVWVGNFEGDSMQDVSGVTGAAPAWHDIMLALHAQHRSLAPTPPDGVTQVAVAFSPSVELPRLEWFASGTELTTVATVPDDAARSRITNPGNGLIIAVDPDIPADRQRVPIRARGATGQLAFRLDGDALGPADAQLLWTPRVGAHRLALVDASGAVLDQVLFTVR